MLKQYQQKELTKALTDKFSILNGAKYFCSGIIQNHLVFIPASVLKPSINILLQKKYNFY